MAEPMKSRFAIDLDDLERQLRDTASTQPKAPPADPLAELARIVGQDDPFKALFTDKPAGRPTPAPQSAPTPASTPAPMPPSAAALASTPAPRSVAPGPSSMSGPALTQGPGARIEPSIDDLLRDFDLAMEKADAGAAKTAAAAAPAAVSRAPAAPSPTPDPADSMVDAFDALLRDELRGGVGRPSSVSQRDPDSDNLAGTNLSRPDLARVDIARVDLDAAGFGARDLDRDLDRELDADPIATGVAARDFRHEPRGAADDGLPDDAAADYPEPPAEPVADMRSLEPQQPRKGLMIAAGLMGVAALGIGAVVGLGGLFGGGSTSTPGGEVPVVRAESGPAKVQPANPGGVDIPNQNKQIFERAGESKPADTRVVNREEQPMDVQAAARQAARVILPAPGAEPSAAAPTAQPPAGTPIAPGIAAAPPAPVPPQASIQPAQPPALGEPRRVRTVSVRPDGTIAPPPGTPEAGNGSGNGAGNGSSSAPQGATPAATPAAPPLRAAQPPATTGSAPVARAPQPPAPPRPPADPSRQQVAAAPATPPVAAPATTAAAPAASPRAGGWMVQLAAPGSEAEARATFSSLQRRHSGQLSGETPVVRRAEANGRTVYRLRIGPYGTRDQAIAKCEALKADGGACFVASN